MSADKLAELEALISKATAGPWSLGNLTSLSNDGEARVIGARNYNIGEIYTCSPNEKRRGHNAALIVWLVNNAPAIIRQQHEALKPFAEYGRALEEVAGSVTGDTHVWHSTVHLNTKITMGDLRKAREALAKVSASSLSDGEV